MKYIHVFIILIFIGCSKEFLEPKADKKLVVPVTLKDMQALLDNTAIMNTSMSRIGEVSADDYYVTETNWNNIPASAISEKHGYIWGKELYKGQSDERDWNDRYLQIYYTNIVLEGLGKLEDKSQTESYKKIAGSAYFFRAKSHFELSQLFCGPYVQGSENNGLGIPLRLDADINKKNRRATIEETYNQIIDDLKNAIKLLNARSEHVMRPNKVAALSLLSRVYLSMQNYEQALQYSTKAIEESDATLLDFNEVTNGTYPMKKYNTEVISHSTLLRGVILSNSMLLIHPDLYDLYEAADLRKDLWFGLVRENLTYKGSYDGSLTMFSGITIAEMHLTKAECQARLQDKGNDALNTLNHFLANRYKSSSFTPVGEMSPKELLTRILQERRKELVFRGIRWTDLRRLNLDPSTAVTLRRVLGDKVFELQPNSINYTLPIPDDVIILGGYEQNPRE